MRVFGLIGFPLSHSFSQKYFTDKFTREGIGNCRYNNYPISSVQQLPSLLSEVPELEGLNITIPYKKDIIPLLHEKNAVVSRIAACNCIRIIKGRLHGFNTDVIGFEQSLRKHLKQ